jgi:hypothetical protein
VTPEAAEDLVRRLAEGDVRALARAISLVEDGADGAVAVLRAAFPRTGRATVLGITGAPGAGKFENLNAHSLPVDVVLSGLLKLLLFFSKLSDDFFRGDLRFFLPNGGLPVLVGPHEVRKAKQEQKACEQMFLSHYPSSANDNSQRIRIEAGTRSCPAPRRSFQV